MTEFSMNEGLERIGNSLQQLIREAQASLSPLPLPPPEEEEEEVLANKQGISIKRKYPAMMGSIITAVIMSFKHSHHSIEYNLMSVFILLTTRLYKAQKPIHFMDKIVIRMCYCNKMSRDILDWIHKTNLCLNIINLILF